MAGALSKRQQARNEKVLQELVHSVPGNNFCADCQARNPSWASWSLGIFLCMRCAAIHRKLGTHVSKVKSLSMDSWTNEQVENMKKVGNLNSNKTYNPKAKRPPVPIDADEADSAMERFVRQKYMSNGGTGMVDHRRHNTGSTESDETPPPLPPKTPSRFGFRSASSIFPLSSKAKREAATRPPPSPRDLSSIGPGSPRRNKPSKGFGASVQYEDSEDTERKLSQLHDMGFTDDQRNSIVLKGVNGNLERAVEALVRLGEGGARSPISLTSPRESTTSAPRSLTPATTASGLSLPQKTTRPASSSNNPFDMLDMPPAQPQSSQSTGTLQNKNPYNSTNPFGVPAAQGMTAFDQAFQNMTIAPSQPLFPHHTGGIPAPQQPQNVVYQQPAVPPMPVMPQNYSAMSFNSNQTYPPPVQPIQTGYNPFLTVQAQAQTQQAPLMLNTGNLGNFGSNPFTRSPTRIQSPLSQIPEQSQQNFYTPSPQSQSWSSPLQQEIYSSPLTQQTTNPFLGQMAPMPQQSLAQPNVFQPQRADKASIMALYNIPQSAPQPYQQPSYQQPSIAGQDPVAEMFGQPWQQQPQMQQQQNTVPASDQPRSIMNSVPGNKNPFLSNGGMPMQAAPVAQPIGMDTSVGNRSRDSMMAAGWGNGRHSPDAFASLSARH